MQRCEFRKQEPPEATWLVTGWGTAMVKKDPVILVDSELATNQQHGICAEIANSILGCIRSSIARRAREAINHLLFSTHYNTSRTMTSFKHTLPRNTGKKLE